MCPRGLQSTYHVRADLPAGNSVHLNHDGGVCDGEGDDMCGDGVAMAIGRCFNRSSHFLAPSWRTSPTQAEL